MPVFPGSLNIAFDNLFDWFYACYEAHRIWFGREEYGGERDILLLPCELISLYRRKAFLWTRRRLRQGIDGIPGSSTSSLTSI
jgi:hypothetical protein